jgi:hypothetical protein
VECECDYGSEPAYTDLSPIIIDVTNLGNPDTLTGVWKRGKSPKVAPYNTTRLFNLDNTRLKRWSWVGPRAGLLVYSASGIPKEVTGKDLFGNATWGQSWKDGYEPLASLDEDNSGALEGKELELLYIWLDANTNAKPDEGEVKSVSEYLTSISVVPTRDEDGNAWNDQGATLLDGSQVGAWDWWTSAYDVPKTMILSTGENVATPYIYVEDSPTPVTIYQWSRVIKGEEKIVGYLRFWKHGDEIYVMSIPEKVEGFYRTPISMCEIGDDRKSISWNFQGLLNTSVDILENGELRGRSINEEGEFYDWTAEIVSSDIPDSTSLDTLSSINIKDARKYLHYGFAFVEPSNSGFVPGVALSDLLD